MNNDTEQDMLDITELPDLELGTSVEVRRRFDRAWARGFEVAGAADEGYRLRRTSDGAVLPVVFPSADVRQAPQAERGFR